MLLFGVTVQLYSFTHKTNHDDTTQEPIHFDTKQNNGYLGSPFDEERSEMRDVMRLASYSETLNS